MSGYTAIIKDKDITINDIENIEKMTHLQGYSENYSYEYYSDQHAAFGFVELREYEPQEQEPLFYLERYCLVFEGKIYNKIDICMNLIEAGYEINTRSEDQVTDVSNEPDNVSDAQVTVASKEFDNVSDEQIIALLYNYKGSDMVGDLKGMFSFVIWDKQGETVFAARDSMGIKPLYYIESGDSIMFSSEMKSVIALDDRQAQINDEALHHYMSFQYVPEPMTIDNDICVVEPGYIIEKKLGEKAEFVQYHHIIFKESTDDFNTKTSKIRSALEKAVEMYIANENSVGSLLSGGIDSTILLALAKQVKPDIKTFTVGFANQGFSEIDYAKETAAELGVENISKIITPEEFIKELPNIVWCLDGPLADPAAIPTYFVCREASKHVDIILSGEGSDEFFGGYNIYREPLDLKGFTKIPKPLKKALLKFASILTEGVKGKSFIERGCTALEDRFIGNANIFKEEEKQILLKNYNKDFIPQRVTGPLYESAKDYDAVAQMLYVDVHTWLRGDILVVADRMTRANSLEVRVPFLDEDVVNIALELNMEDRVGNNTTKYALREAFRGIVPDSVYTRKKLGFPVPIRHWLKDELYEWAKDLIESSGAGDLINKKYALELLDLHKNGSIDYSRKVWNILIFIIWHQIYIEG